MFKQMKIGTKFYVLIGIATIIIFTVFALYLNHNISRTINENLTESMNENLLNVETMVKLEIVSQQEKTFVSGNLAKIYFQFKINVLLKLRDLQKN